VSLDARLLEILACPDTHHAPLTYDPAAQTLTCTECARVFEIRDGIPVLLLEEDDRVAEHRQARERRGHGASGEEEAGTEPQEAG
jgi:hypothetical protein